MKHHLFAKAVGLAAGILLLSSGAMAQEGPAVSISRLTLETVKKIADGTIEACRAQGVQITVTVVDRDGVVQIIQRDTVAPPISVEISRRKAYTAANFTAATSALADRANSAVGRVEPLVMSAGGLPIQAAGQLLGAVGVSGAPSGETDEACAQAGIDRVIDDLELSL